MQKQRSPRICCRYVAVMAIVLVGQGFFAPICHGQKSISRLVKRSARIADDVAIHNLDSVQRFLRQSPDAVESVLKRDFDEALQRLGKKRALQKALGELADVASDRSTARILEQLDDQTAEAALMICNGSKRIADDIGDLTLRGRMVRDAGPETLASLGRHTDLTDDFRRFYTAVDTGALRSPKGMRNLNARDFGQFFTQHGQRAKHFWDKYVAPNWKLWLGGTALAAVMLSPDEYLDAAGDITNAGLRKIGRLGGSMLEGALSGVVEAVGDTVKGAVSGVAQGTANSFFTSLTGWVSLILIVLAVALFFQPTRLLMFAGARKILNRSARENQST